MHDARIIVPEQRTVSAVVSDGPTYYEQDAYRRMGEIDRDAHVGNRNTPLPACISKDGKTRPIRPYYVKAYKQQTWSLHDAPMQCKAAATYGGLASCLFPDRPADVHHVRQARGPHLSRKVNGSCTYILLCPTASIPGYALCPFLIVAVGVRASSSTRFVENMCNICIFK